jgi:AcrR family transcriptional regulator
MNIDTVPPDNAKRRYDTSLRNRQAEQTRELIVRAAADIVSEGGLPALTVAEVARRAGVSLRTVWRNFPNTDALMEGIDAWFTVNVGPPVNTVLDDIPVFMEALYRYFEDNAPYMLSSLAWRFSQAETPPARAERVRGFIRQLIDLTPALKPEQRRMGEAALTLLPNGISWAALRKDLGWSAEESARAVGAILELVIAELMRVNAEAGSEPPKQTKRERRKPV